VGETGFWYNEDYIDQMYGDHDDVFEDSDMDAFYRTKKGWEPTASGPADAEAQSVYQEIVDLGIAVLPYLLANVEGQPEFIPAIVRLTGDRGLRKAQPHVCGCP